MHARLLPGMAGVLLQDWLAAPPAPRRCSPGMPSWHSIEPLSTIRFNTYRVYYYRHFTPPSPHGDRSGILYVR